MDEFEELLAIEQEKWSNRPTTEVWDLLSKTFNDILELYTHVEDNTGNMLNEIHETNKWNWQHGEPLSFTDNNTSLKGIKKILRDDFKTPHDNPIGLQYYFLALLNLYSRLLTSKKEISVPTATLFKAQSVSMDISFSLGFAAGLLTGRRGHIEATQKANKTKQNDAENNRKAIFHTYKKLVTMQRLKKKPTQAEAYYEIKKYAEKYPEAGIKSYSQATIIRALKHKGVF